MSIEYLAGLIASDGHIAKRDYKIKIISTNFLFVTKIRQMLILNGIKSAIYKGTTGYEVYMYNKSFWSTLVKEFEIPSGKKAFDLQKPKIKTKKGRTEFLRGLLDGDSSIFETKATLRRKNKVYKYFVPRIEFKSKSKPIVDWSLDLLKELGINPYIQKDPKFHRWFLDGANNMRKFDKIGFLHPQKQKKLKQIISSYKNNSYYRPFSAG